jgi:predicted RNA-binding protein
MSDLHNNGIEFMMENVLLMSSTVESDKVNPKIDLIEDKSGLNFRYHADED